MKQIVTVRSNPFFTQEENKSKISLEAQLELIIIFTDGKTYKWKKDGDLIPENKLTETRLIVSPEMLAYLITELQLHQKKLQVVRHNADQINALINHITDLPDEFKVPATDGKTL
jgi:DNA polymerase III alpha subunit (gram-positive type)